MSWDLSKPAGSPESDCPELRRIARHFRRGHWRRAQPHYEGATQRPDAIRPEDRARWWQWIEGRYVGDHTLGIKKSYHAPKMSTGRLAGMPLVGLLHAEGLPDD